jgi:prepilin-type N-terminal cleavage/methylation domain-containing protein
MRTSLIKNLNGFSLLEMLIVISLFVLIGGISLPAFTDWLYYNKLKKTSLIFEDILNTAKSRAEDSQKFVQVNLINENNVKKIEIIDGASEPVICSEMIPESIYRSYLLEAEITEESGMSKVCFSPNGFATAASFKIKKNDKLFQFKINKYTSYIEKID